MCIAGDLDDFDAPFEIQAEVRDPGMNVIEEAAVLCEPLEPGRIVDPRMRPSKTYALGIEFTATGPGVYMTRWTLEPGGAHAELSIFVSLITMTV